MRVFAQEYRADAAGLVLVDSMHEDQFDVFGPTFPPPTPSDPPALEGMRRFLDGRLERLDSTVERIDFVEAIRQAARWCLGRSALAHRHGRYLPAYAVRAAGPPRDSQGLW